uniref:Phospholipid/glycerol acyltransferase domain-containing protein n=1 Tax=Ciona savignyi TaxID=51511 RepID=H2YXC2_CIOSA
MVVYGVIKTVLRFLKASSATAIMVGVAPTVAIFHTGWRVVSIFLPRRCFHSGEDFLWGSYQKVIVFFFEHMTGVEILISGDMPKEKENNILICNHQCTMDWISTDFLAIRQNMVGNMRYVFKDAIKYIPLYGYVFGMHGGVFVKRDGTYNQTNMQRVLRSLMKHKVDMYFIVFPEGTRYSSKRKQLLAKSQAYAIENDLAPLNEVLTPRVKAFHCALSTMKDYVSAVYDATILYETQSTPIQAGHRPSAPSMWQFLMSEKPRIRIQFDRIPVEDIPSSTQTSTLRWLHNRFARKDLLISQHYGLQEDVENHNNVAVFGNEEHSNLPLLKTLPSTLAFTTTTSALLLHPLGRLVYFGTVLGGSILGMAYANVFF